jgi:hypothetical protein
MGSTAPIDEQSEATNTNDVVTNGDTAAPDLIENVAAVVAENLDDAAGSIIPIAELHGGDGDGEQASDYWDASSMAPLNAVSAVSIRKIFIYERP